MKHRLDFEIWHRSEHLHKIQDQTFKRNLKLFSCQMTVAWKNWNWVSDNNNNNNKTPENVLLITFIKRYSPLSSRLTALTCDSTGVNGFL